MTVTLVVDGVSHRVQTRASTVRSLLVAEHVPVTPRDIVAPEPGGSLRDGEQVVVRYARPLTLDLDGVGHVYWTTELTVEAAMNALGIRTDGARMSSSRSQPLGRSGLALTVSTPKRVTLAADGSTRQLVTTAPTVADLLVEQGVVPRPSDKVSVLPSAPITDGLVVAVTRIDRQRATSTQIMPFGVVRRTSSAIAAGSQKITTVGRPGSRRVVYDIVLADGLVVSRTLVSTTVVTQPVSQVVAVGPAKVVASSVGGAVDSLNWTALAQCESGGNPKAVNPAGYYGLYQFSPSTWASVGGTGLPSNASASEQLLRAKLLYQRGGSAQWGCGSHLFD